MAVKNRISKLEKQLQSNDGFWFSPESTVLCKLMCIKPGESIWVEKGTINFEKEVLPSGKKFIGNDSGKLPACKRGTRKNGPYRG